MLHALSRSKLQQSIDLKETESISCHTLRAFVTVWFFLIISGPDEEPHWRDVVTSPSCRRGKLQRMASPDFGPYCCFEEVLHRINIIVFESDQSNFFSLTIESNVTGEEQNKLRDVPYSLRISCWYTATLWRHLQSRTPRSSKIMISGTLHEILRPRMWNSAMLTETEFATLLLSIVSSAKMKVKQPLLLLRAYS